MQDIGSIRQKLKQAAFRHLKRKLGAELRVLPENCYHNQRMSLPKQGGSIGVCRYGWGSGSWPGVCDSKVKDCSQGCPHFQPNKAKEEIKADFNKFLGKAPLFEIAAEGMADVASLLWVLGEDAPGRGLEVSADLKTVEVFGIPIPVDESQETALNRVLSLLEDKDQEFSEALETAQETLATLKEEGEVRAMDHAHVSTQLQEALRAKNALEKDLAKVSGQLAKVSGQLAKVRQERQALWKAAQTQTWWQRLWGRPPELADLEDYHE